MSEIEVGEYVRTDCMITKAQEGFIDILEKGKSAFGKVVKHSFNLIDLIEVGDIIQLKGAEELKYEVLKISCSPSKGKHIHIINPFRTEGGKDIFIEDIKSIVTKEQFKSVEYVIEED